MASIEKIKERISEIAEQRKNTTEADIQWVIGQLKANGFPVRDPKKTVHTILFGIGPVRFAICPHNRGSKQLKPCYVDEFIRAMIELGLYE